MCTRNEHRGMRVEVNLQKTRARSASVSQVTVGGPMAGQSSTVPSDTGVATGQWTAGVLATVYITACTNKQLHLYIQRTHQLSAVKTFWRITHNEIHLGHVLRLLHIFHWWLTFRKKLLDYEKTPDNIQSIYGISICLLQRPK